MSDMKENWSKYVAALRSGNMTDTMDAAAMGFPALEKINQSSRPYNMIKALRRMFGPLDVRHDPVDMGDMRQGEKW